MDERDKIMFKVREYIFENSYKEETKKLCFKEIDKYAIDKQVMVLRLKGINTIQALKLISCMPQLLFLTSAELMDNLNLVFKDKNVHTAMLLQEEGYLWTQYDIITNSFFPAKKLSERETMVESFHGMEDIKIKKII